MIEEIEILTLKILQEMVAKYTGYMMMEEFRLTTPSLMKKIQKKQYLAMDIEIHKECSMIKMRIRYGYMNMALEGEMKLI